MAGSGDRGVVIIAVDGSEAAEDAFDFYVANLRQPTDRVFLLHSAEPPQITSQQAMYMSGELWEELLSREKVRVKELEEKFSTKMKNAGVSGTIKAMFRGQPGETICDMAKDEKATLIVMGTRGLGTLRRTIMGSVSDYVVHHAHCPVCICRE